MKKNLFSVFMLLLVATFLVSCEKENKTQGADQDVKIELVKATADDITFSFTPKEGIDPYWICITDSAGLELTKSFFGIDDFRVYMTDSKYNGGVKLSGQQTYTWKDNHAKHDYILYVLPVDATRELIAYPFTTE